MLRDSTTTVGVVGTRPRELPLATNNMRKSIHGYPLYFPIWVWGSAWWTFGPLELRYKDKDP